MVTGAGIDERIRVTLTIEWLFLFFGCLLVLGHIGLLLSHIYISKLFFIIKYIWFLIIIINIFFYLFCIVYLNNFFMGKRFKGILGIFYIF